MANWQPGNPGQQPQPPYGYQPQPYGQQWQQPYYYQQPRPDDRRTVTYQQGSTVFHVIMTFFTGGLWIFVWLACRRKVRVRVRYR